MPVPAACAAVGHALAPAFEVWEVKITGTASRLNRRFHLPGQIKAPAAGARLPHRRPPHLQKNPTDSPAQLPLSLSLSLSLSLPPDTQLWGFFWCH